VRRYQLNAFGEGLGRRLVDLVRHVVLQEHFNEFGAIHSLGIASARLDCRCKQLAQGDRLGLRMKFA